MTTKKFEIKINIEYSSKEDISEKQMELDLEEAIQKSIDHGFFTPKDKNIQVSVWNCNISKSNSKDFKYKN
ncbi:MAG: hypothetical protein AABY22_27720 [Nanoarchaeota archaeon]